MCSVSFVGQSFSTLVTGGTGFLGRHLVERLLAAGRSVTILGRTPAPDLEKRGVRFIRASLDDATAVAAACTGIDTIFHVAAKVGVWGPYQEVFKTNVLGTRALLDWMAAEGEAMSVCLVGEPTCPAVLGEAMKIGRRGSLKSRCHQQSHLIL